MTLVVGGDSRFVSSTVVDFDGSSVLNSSSLPSPRVFRVSKSFKYTQVVRKYDVFSTPRVFRVQHAQLFRKYVFSSPSPVLSRENLSEVGPTFILIRPPKLDLQATGVCAGELF